MTETYIVPHNEGSETLVMLQTRWQDEAPMIEYPWLVWGFIKLKHPLENGLWGDYERDVLLDAAAKLEDDAEKRDLVYAGLRVQEGWCELYFYGPQAKGFQKLLEAVFKDTGYAFETGSSRDPKWEHYRFELTPDARTLQMLHSHEILEALEVEEDDLSQEREVEHYLFFQTEAQRDRMVEAMEEQGFTCKERTYNSKEEFAYGMVLCKVMALDSGVIHEDVGMLFDRAKKEHGVYEGWSTTLAS